MRSEAERIVVRVTLPISADRFSGLLVAVARPGPAITGTKIYLHRDPPFALFHAKRTFHSERILRRVTLLVHMLDIARRTEYEYILR